MNNRITYALLFLLSLCGSCKQTTKEEHGHSHDQELEPLAYTLYSNHTELFVEFKPLVVGSKSKFASHLTVLGDEFKALTEGNVTVSLVVNGKGIRAKADSAASPGIFRLALQPNHAGSGKLVFDVATKNFSDQFVIDNINVYPDEASALKAQPTESGSSDISYLKEQAWKVPFANTTVTRQSFAKVIHASGSLLPEPNDEVLITAASNGVLRFANRNFSIGSPVGAGAALFTIKAEGLPQGSIDASYQQAKNKVNEAKRNFERAKELVEDKIISERDYLNSKLQYDNALIEMNMLSKNNSASSRQCSSPISGYIKNISVNEGQYVTAGTPLAVISKNRKVQLQANVSQKYIGLLPGISAAKFKVQGNPTVYNTQDLHGRVVSYGKQAVGGYVPLLFELDYHLSFMPGQAVEFFLQSNATNNVIVLPETALMEEQGVYYVYVQTGGEQFQKREVAIGESDGSNVQILSGIDEGERVVTKGAYQIKLATASGAMPEHGHEH